MSKGGAGEESIVGTNPTITDRINHLERDVSGIAVQLNSISHSIEALTNRIHKPTNWLGLGGLAVVICGGMITFVQLNLKPLEGAEQELAKGLMDQRESIETHASDGHSHKVAANALRTEKQGDEIKTMILLTREILEQRITALEKKVDKIDNFGLAKWAKPSNEPE